MLKLYSVYGVNPPTVTPLYLPPSSVVTSVQVDSVPLPSLFCATMLKLYSVYGVNPPTVTPLYLPPSSVVTSVQVDSVPLPSLFCATMQKLYSVYGVNPPTVISVVGLSTSRLSSSSSLPPSQRTRPVYDMRYVSMLHLVSDLCQVKLTLSLSQGVQVKALTSGGAVWEGSVTFIDFRSTFKNIF